MRSELNMMIAVDVSRSMERALAPFEAGNDDVHHRSLLFSVALGEHRLLAFADRVLGQSACCARGPPRAILGACGRRLPDRGARRWFRCCGTRAHAEADEHRVPVRL
jgi:hypothetical protein